MRLQLLILFLTHLFNSQVVGQDTVCSNQTIGKVSFKRNSSKLSLSAKAQLNNFINQINLSPTCEIFVTSYSEDLCEECDVVSWDRQKAVIRYLVKKGGAKARFRPFTLLEGKADFLALSFTSAPLSEKAPHPKLKRKE